MIDKGCALEGPAMRSSEAATGTRSRMPACSISTTTGPTTATTTSASADPSIQRLDDGTPSGGSFLVERVPEETPKARHTNAQLRTAAGPTGTAAERSQESDFYDLTALPNLFACWQKAKRNKGRFERIQRFGEDPLRYLLTIQKKLRDRTYKFGPYKTFTVREKKWRDVVDAPMKDRIVHWMLYEYLLPILEPRFIHDTFGNLPGRGTHAAVNRLADFCRRESCTWALQLDISKYFYAVPHAQLKARALRYIGDEEIRRLIVSLIDSFRTGDDYDHLFDPASPYRQTAAKGMPIGNLSSQLFANIYLSDFDHWVKETLRERHYIRYVDDMVILGDSPEQLHATCALIVTKLADDGLIIHPHKTRIAPVAAGVPFLGYVIWGNHISAGQRLRQRYHYRLRQHESGEQDRSQALNSYRAALAHTGATR